MESNEIKACTVIKNYLNTDMTLEDIYKSYELAVKTLISNSTSGNTMLSGVSSYQEGNISVTFKDSVNTGAWAVTEDIKALLPTPFIKMYY